MPIVRLPYAVRPEARPVRTRVPGGQADLGRASAGRRPVLPLVRRRARSRSPTAILPEHQLRRRPRAPDRLLDAILSGATWPLDRIGSTAAAGAGGAAAGAGAQAGHRQVLLGSVFLIGRAGLRARPRPPRARRTCSGWRRCWCCRRSTWRSGLRMLARAAPPARRGWWIAGGSAAWGAARDGAVGSCCEADAWHRRTETRTVLDHRVLVGHRARGRAPLRARAAGACSPACAAPRRGGRAARRGGRAGAGR